MGDINKNIENHSFSSTQQELDNLKWEILLAQNFNTKKQLNSS